MFYKRDFNDLVTLSSANVYMFQNVNSGTLPNNPMIKQSQRAGEFKSEAAFYM